MINEEAEKKIKYMVELGFSDLMKDDRCISFSILIPVQFNTEREAVEGQNYFFARMEYLDKEVVINIYEKNMDLQGDSKIIKTIRWEDYYSYECSIQKENCIGKLCIDAMSDEEPCSEKFDVIFNKLIGDYKNVTSFSLQCLSYCVRPAFENSDLIQWSMESNYK